MKKPDARKIYLSKSNSAMNDDIRKAREYLKSRRYEVIEYNGGENYDPSQMLECEMMVMVGYDFSFDVDTLREVGKGQYEQLEYRTKHGLNENYYMEYDGQSEDGFDFYYCETIEVRNPDNWTTGYGVIDIFFDEPIHLVSGPGALPHQNVKGSFNVKLVKGRPFKHRMLHRLIK